MQRPERIIQFGEGNFLRAFVDWIVYNMNEKTDFNSSVVVVQPIDKGMVDMLNAQDNLYHVNLQGLDKGEWLTALPWLTLSVVPQPIFSERRVHEIGRTTWNAFRYFKYRGRYRFRSFLQARWCSCIFLSGKLTQLLYHRFKTFNGDKSSRDLSSSHAVDLP